jgi:hypothetical protein
LNDDEDEISDDEHIEVIPKTAEMPIEPTVLTNQINGAMHHIIFLSNHINPKYLASADFWTKGSSTVLFEKAMQEHAAVEREKKLLTSRIRGLLGVQKIHDTINQDNYPTLVGELQVSLRDNHTIQALLRDIIKLNNNVESVNILQFKAQNNKVQSLLHIPRSSRMDLS